MIPVVYTDSNCQPCRALKRWLTTNNVVFTEKNARDYLEEMMEMGYGRTVPVLVYRGHVVHGFDTTKLQEIFPE